MEYITMGIITIAGAGAIFWQQWQIEKLKADVNQLWVPEVEYLDTAEEFFDGVAEATGLDQPEVPQAHQVAQ
jgi:hypothetical protein